MKKIKKRILSIILSVVMMVMLFTGVLPLEVNAANFYTPSIDKESITLYDSGCLKSLTITVQAYGSYGPAYGRIGIHNGKTPYNWDKRFISSGCTSWPDESQFISGDSTFITFASGEEFLWTDCKEHTITFTFDDGKVDLSKTQTYHIYLWTRSSTYGIYTDAYIGALQTENGGLLDGNGNTLIETPSVPAPHVHSWTYSSNETTDIISATCTADCDAVEVPSISINASDMYYSGAAYDQSGISGTWPVAELGLETYAIRYVSTDNRGYDSFVAPTEIGEYKVVVTVNNASVEVEFAILAPVVSPVIVSGPEDQTVREGETASFSVTADGRNLSYQWQVNRNDGNGFVNISGATNASYTTSVVDMDCDGFEYQCIITNEAGSVTSTQATLSVVHVHNLILGPEKAPSCTTNGNILYYKCSSENCDSLFADEEGTIPLTLEDVVIVALKHDMSDATCTEAAKCQRSGCDYEEGTELGHDMGDATCTEAAKCLRSGCNYTEGTELGHDMGDATCTEAAKCQRSGCSYTEGTELGHDMGDATCTEAAKCQRSGCDYEEGTELGHDMGDATCTEAAKCQRSGCNYTEGTSLGHDMSDATCTEAAKCQRSGCDYEEGTSLGHDMGDATCTEVAKCQRSGCNYTEGTSLGHDWSENWSKDETTHWHKCNNEGCTEVKDTEAHQDSEDSDYACDKCGYVLHTHELELVGAVSASCTQNGNKEYYKCVAGNCDCLFEDSEGNIPTTLADVKIDKLGHDMSAATCTEAAKCQRSGCNYEEGTELGHDMGDATCTEAAKCQRSGCNYTEGTSLGHDMGDATCTEAAKCQRSGCNYTEGTSLGHDMSEATCTEASECMRSDCDYTEAAPGHDWSGEWTITKEATETEEGKKETLCVRGCGQKKLVVIPATGAGEDIGNVEKDTEVKADAPVEEATLDNSKEELLETDSIFTEEEKQQIDNGEDARIWLEISRTDEDSIASEDKDKLEQEAANIMGENPNINYFDADLFKQIGNEAKEEISEPGMPIRITIMIPDRLLNHDESVAREYSVLRLHDGHVDTINGTFNKKTGEFSFESDKFSTYAIVYKDVPVKNNNTEPTPETNQNPLPGTDPVKPVEDKKDEVPKTGESNTTLYSFMFMLISGLGIIFYSRRKDTCNEEK